MGLEPSLWLQPVDGFTMVGAGRAWSVEAEGTGRFGEVAAAWERLLAGAQIAGGVSGGRGVGPLADRRPRVHRGGSRRSGLVALRRGLDVRARTAPSADARRPLAHGLVHPTGTRRAVRRPAGRELRSRSVCRTCGRTSRPGRPRPGSLQPRQAACAAHDRGRASGPPGPGTASWIASPAPSDAAGWTRWSWPGAWI